MTESTITVIDYPSGLRTSSRDRLRRAAEHAGEFLLAAVVQYCEIRVELQKAAK